MGLPGQKLVCHSGVGVLLLYESGNAHLAGHIECGTAGIATHSHRHLRTEIADDAQGHVTAAHQIPQDGNVPKQVLAVEAPDGQAFDFIPCRGDALHLHPPFCTNKKYLCVRSFGPYGVGYRNGREDVSSRSATTDDHSEFLVHISVTVYSIRQKYELFSVGAA